MKVVNINNTFEEVSDYWTPLIIGELNNQCVKIARLKGEFVSHKHDNEDEMFLVIKGTLKIEFSDRTELINEGEFIIVPKGVVHKPIADNEVKVLLFEPASTVNTGNIINELTHKKLRKLL